MKCYDDVFFVWTKVIDSHNLHLLHSDQYDRQLNLALKAANQAVENHGWKKEDFYSEMDRRSKN